MDKKESSPWEKKHPLHSSQKSSFSPSQKISSKRTRLKKKTFCKIQHPSLHRSLSYRIEIHPKQSHELISRKQLQFQKVDRSQPSRMSSLSDRMVNWLLKRFIVPAEIFGTPQEQNQLFSFTVESLFSFPKPHQIHRKFCHK